MATVWRMEHDKPLLRVLPHFEFGQLGVKVELEIGGGDGNWLSLMTGSESKEKEGDEQPVIFHN